MSDIFQCKGRIHGDTLSDGIEEVEVHVHSEDFVIRRKQETDNTGRK